MGVTARGFINVFSCSRALSAHVQWAIERHLLEPIQWRNQPLLDGAVCTEVRWQGEPGTAAALVSALRQCGDLRFEVTEEPTSSSDGQRYAFTPNLGLWVGTMGASGETLVRENHLRTLVDEAIRNGQPLTFAVDAALGSAWDHELEPFRLAADNPNVRWLHSVG